MDRRFIRPACLALSVVFALPLAGCSQEVEEVVMDPSVTVRTTAAQTGSLTKEGSYIGSVSAEGTAYVVSLVSGTVEEIGVSVGDEVQAGDFLCRIDDESAQLTLQTARAAVRTAQAAVSSANAGMASANAGRSSAAAGVMSAEAGQEQAEAAVNSARESYRSAAAQYGGGEDTDALPVIEEQVRLAQENYDNTLALFEIGAASQIEVDQAYQTKISAEAGLASAKAGLSSAAAGVAQAESSLSSAAAGQASAKAGQEQAEAGVLSAQAGMEQAQAAVEQAQASVASAEYQLTLYNITAPISGTVESVNVTKNNFTSSGSAIFVISNGSNKTVTFYVTEQVRKVLTLGQTVTANHGGRSYTGAVTEIGGVVDATAGQFKVKAIIEDADDLPDGLSVELTTVANKADSAIILPSDALFFENGEAYVYVVRDGAAARTPVTVSIYTTESSAVTEGLTPGDEVITTWSSSLRDGVRVSVSGSEG